MIKKAEELKATVYPKRFDGLGEIAMTPLLSPDQFHGKGRVFARIAVKPASSIGRHQHQGDFEVFYFLSGEGIVDDNGKDTPVKAGDVVITETNEWHTVTNTGATDLEMIALVLFD